MSYEGPQPLSVTAGGTGRATLTSNGSLYGNVTGVIGQTAQLKAGQTLIAPTSTSAPTPTFSTNQYNTYIPAFNILPPSITAVQGTIHSLVSPYGFLEAFNTTTAQNTNVAMSATAGFGWNVGSFIAGNAKACEFTEGNSVNGKNLFTIGTSPAFFVKATFAIATLASVAEVSLGFRVQQSYQTTLLTAYTDYACLSINTATGNGAVVTQTQKTSGGEVLTNTTNTVTAATLFTLEVDITSGGVVTYKLNGSAPTTTVAYTFTNALAVIPFITFSQAAAANTEIDLATYQCGLQ